MLKDLADQSGRRFLDLLVGDAIYLQAPFVKEVEDLDLDWVFTLKENQPELLREAERFTTGSPAAVQSDPKQELRCGHLPQLDWPVADRLVGVVKTVRIDHKRQVTVNQHDHHLQKSKPRWRWRAPTFTPPTSNWARYPHFVNQLGRSRWRIDVEVFQTITTDCQLKRPAVHQSTALVVLTMVRLLAYALSLVFYQRQVCSHTRGPCDSFHEFARRLAYGFVALSPNTS